MKLSIVIPAHNEEDRLPPVLKAYAELFSTNLKDEVEILVVVNASADGTYDVSCQIAEQFDCVRVIEEPRKVGKGGAVLLGVRQAAGEWIGYADADGATSAEEFLRLFQTGQSHDGIIASRWMEGADVTIPQKGLRQLTSRCFNLLTRGLLGLKYVDTQCGAKIFSASAWQAILPEVGTTRFAFDVDLLFQLKRQNFEIIEEPTVWHDVEGSKVNVMSSSFEMFLAIVRMRILFSPFRGLITAYDTVLSRLVESLRMDSLFRHASLLFSAAMVGHICNIIFQMVVSRGISGPEYGLMVSFLAVIGIVSRPMGAVGVAMTHYSSLLVAEKREGDVKRLVGKWCGITGSVSLVLMVLTLLSAEHLSSFFHLERLAPVIVSALALPVIFMAPVIGGALRGMQLFGWTSLSAITGSIGRVILAAVFVYLVFPASGWALLGHVGGLYINAVFMLIVLWMVLRKVPACGQALPSLRFYLIQCVVVQLALGTLMTGDVILVKHFFPEDLDFAYAATLGRMVAFLTMAIVGAMFPKLASSGIMTREHRSVYLRSLLYTSGLVFLGLLFCCAVPELLLRVLLGVSEPSEVAVQLTRWVSLIMAIVALLNINVNLLLAQRRFIPCAIVVLCALTYIGGVAWAPVSSLFVVQLCGGLSALALIVTTISIFRTPVESVEA